MSRYFTFSSFVFLLGFYLLPQLVSIAGEALSESRQQYLAELDKHLSSGVLYKPGDCREIPPGTKTNLLKEIIIPNLSGDVLIDGCDVYAGVPGPVVIPAQPLTFLGCHFDGFKPKEIEDLAEQFSKDRQRHGLFFGTETGHAILVRCHNVDGIRWWSEGMERVGLFSSMRVFPTVLGGEEQPSESTTADGFPFDG